MDYCFLYNWHNSVTEYMIHIIAQFALYIFVQPTDKHSSYYGIERNE